MTCHEPQPDDALCNDPRHDADCGCGATPDRDYEVALDI